MNESQIAMIIQSNFSGIWNKLFKGRLMQIWKSSNVYLYKSYAPKVWRRYGFLRYGCPRYINKCLKMIELVILRIMPLRG